MNIEQAMTIPLSVILDKMGQVPQCTTNGKIRFFFPCRKENTPSLEVCTHSNQWFDFVEGKGGNPVELVQIWLDGSGVRSDTCSALRWLCNMTDWKKLTPVNDDDDCYHGSCEGSNENLLFKKAEPVTKAGLLRYGERRGIPPFVLKKYLQQVYFLNKETGISIFALAMKNESKGYQLRNQLNKDCIRKKDVTFIRGTKEPQTSVHVFECMMDYLTIITQREGKPMEDDAIILHSLSCMEKGAAFIRNYGYQQCYTWFDNDDPGQKATLVWDEFCAKEEGLTHTPMNGSYTPYKDVNAAHMARLEL